MTKAYIWIGISDGTEFALMWGMVPDDSQDKGGRQSCKAGCRTSIISMLGCLGTKTILNALSENGYADLHIRLHPRKHFLRGDGGS